MAKRIPVDLIVRSFHDSLSESDREELDSWLGQEGNREIYSEIAGLWSDVRQNASDYDPDAEKLWKEFRRKAGLRHGRRRILHIIPVAAAAVLLAVFIPLYFLQQDREPDKVVMSSVYGKSRNVLPDGSVIWLKSGTELEYESGTFGRRDRSVSLDGEAYFDVRTDRKRPFRVHVGGLQIEVTGTEFNVRESEGRICVSLLEGSVSLYADPGCPVNIVAGQKAIYDKVTGEIECRNADMDMDVCWASGSLNFKAKPLGYICQYLSVWYGVKIIPVHTLENEYAYTFTVTDEPLEEILRIMGKINPIEYEKSGKVYKITEL